MEPMDYLCVSFIPVLEDRDRVFGSPTALVTSAAPGISDALRETGGGTG